MSQKKKNYNSNIDLSKKKKKNSVSADSLWHAAFLFLLPGESFVQNLNSMEQHTDTPAKGSKQ